MGMKPTSTPTYRPTDGPTYRPTWAPTHGPTYRPTFNPTDSPTAPPTFNPTDRPTAPPPTDPPTDRPTGSPDAVYDPNIGAPICWDVTAHCTTINNGLHISRNSLTPPEPNEPNTICNCTDGSGGQYKSSESIEAVTVKSTDNKPLKAGNRARIFARVFAYSSGTLDRADFYHSNNPGKDTIWHYISTAIPAAGGIINVDSGEFTVQSAYLQAVRVVFRWAGEISKASFCPGGQYTDVDDLAFVVDTQHISNIANSTLDVVLPGAVSGPQPENTEENLKVDCVGFEKLRCEVTEDYCVWEDGDCLPLE